MKSNISLNIFAAHSLSCVDRRPLISSGSTHMLLLLFFYFCSAFAVLRGWTVGHGLPDESRAGRQLLKDYTAGKLVHCLMPPGELRMQ